MKLLLDQNLSQRLVPSLLDLFPDSAHVRQFSMERADDAAIWTFARDHGFAIVSKDEDFHQRSFLYGHPPKVIWLRLGNCSTQELLATLRRRASEIIEFDADRGAALLLVSS